MPVNNPKPYLSVPCQGEAHKRPLVVGCDDCFPFWAYIPTCPDCQIKLKLTSPRGLLTCPTCHQTFERLNAIQVGDDL